METERSIMSTFADQDEATIDSLILLDWVVVNYRKFDWKEEVDTDGIGLTLYVNIGDIRVHLTSTPAGAADSFSLAFTENNKYLLSFNSADFPEIERLRDNIKEYLDEQLRKDFIEEKEANAMLILQKLQEATS